MMPEGLSQENRNVLLKLARQSMTQAVKEKHRLPLDLNAYAPVLQQHGASFVTLTVQGDLRGCIGALEAYQPLVEDVCEHAIAAALEDYRFPPVNASELDSIQIEISRLTQPQALSYLDPNDLVAHLTPGQDGVILKDGLRRATFLPQVWEKLPDPAQFLGNLCEKMGASYFLWQKKKLQVLTYKVEEFHE
jgi:AmmeMemoRadiSam system protein A